MTKKFALEILELSKLIPVPQEDIDKATKFLLRMYSQLSLVESKLLEIRLNNLYRKLNHAIIPDLSEEEIHLLASILTKWELKQELSEIERKILNSFRSL